MAADLEQADIVMLGTFSVWRLGSLQARALPFARAIRDQARLRTAIITTPWDVHGEAGTIDIVGGIPIINTSTTDPRAAPFAVREQLRWVARLRPQVVHVFKPRGFGGLAGALLKRLRPDTHVLVDSDDWEGDGGWNQRNDYSALQRRLFAWQEPALLASADHVTAASWLLARRARDLRADSDSVILLPNGLEQDWIERLQSARRGSNPKPSRPTILLYSRFAEFPEDWLARFTRCLSEHARQPARLLLVGNLPAAQIPPDQPGVEIAAHGFVPKERLPEILAAATIAIYPYDDNLVNRSKQSVKLLEMMAAGCPIIASDIGEIAATLGAGGCALPGSDPALFARSALGLLDQPGRLAEMGREGQRRVHESFGITELARRLACLYRDLGVTGPC